MTTTPKTLYDAAITYRTPSGKAVRFSSMVAADTLVDCEKELRYRLHNADKFGRRKVDSVVGHFSASPMGKQIATR